MGSRRLSLLLLIRVRIPILQSPVDGADEGEDDDRDHDDEHDHGIMYVGRILAFVLYEV